MYKGYIKLKCQTIWTDSSGLIVGADLGPNCLPRISAVDTGRQRVKLKLLSLRRWAIPHSIYRCINESVIAIEEFISDRISSGPICHLIILLISNMSMVLWSEFGIYGRCLSLCFYVGLIACFRAYIYCHEQTQHNMINKQIKRALLSAEQMSCN